MKRCASWVKCGYVPLRYQKHWRILRPISLKLRKADGEWFAESYWLNHWGVGKSRMAAMEDFMISLFDLTEILESEPLGVGLARDLARIKTYIAKRLKKPKRRKP